MKKCIITVCVLVFAASSAFAVNFAPTLLKLSAPEMIQYAFDGSDLDIEVAVSGKDANLLFMVYTKGQADAIGLVQNGFLGWHYMNKIDTCIYWSLPGTAGRGSNVISWDGKDADGGTVPAGDYTYYIWAYDSFTPKELALQAFSQGETNMMKPPTRREIHLLIRLSTSVADISGHWALTR